MSQHPENPARSAPGPAGQSGHLVHHENPAAVRVREAPARNGVGRELYGRPDQRYLPAADLVFAVPPMSALFPAQYGPVQGEVPGGAGKRLQAGLATD